jgi:hydroxymethylglutaryl-CoA reductase
LKVDAGKFLSFVHLDSIGARTLGCQFYSGMGGEIIPAVFKATQVNPQSPLVSAFQYIHSWTDHGDLIYRVELPNVEVGIASCREGIISPTAREALRIMGIRTAREFAASLAAQVLAGEFNLALEISREKLYKS